MGKGSWDAWLASAPGRYVLDWEQRQLDAAVADVFGFHALQCGLPQLDGLRANRMPNRMIARAACQAVPDDGSAAVAAPGSAVAPGSAAASGAAAVPAATAAPDAAAVAADTAAIAPDAAAVATGVMAAPDVAAVAPGILAAASGTVVMLGTAGALPVRPVLIDGFEELPFATASLDLVVLPHALEFADDPHQVLREVDRVLRPEGRVIVTGFNPVSLWGARQAALRGIVRPFLPVRGRMLSVPRLRDWMRLLSFEPDRGRFGCYVPPCRTERWLARLQWVEKAGDRWWPICGALYLMSAVKRVRGMRLIGPVWKPMPSKAAVAGPAPVRHGQAARSRGSDESSRSPPARRSKPPGPTARR